MFIFIFSLMFETHCLILYCIIFLYFFEYLFLVLFEIKYDKENVVTIFLIIYLLSVIRHKCLKKVTLFMTVFPHSFLWEVSLYKKILYQLCKQIFFVILWKILHPSCLKKGYSPAYIARDLTYSWHRKIIGKFSIRASCSICQNQGFINRMFQKHLSTFPS